MASTIRNRTIAGVFGVLLVAVWALSPTTAAATPPVGVDNGAVVADESATIKVDANVRAQPNTSSTILTTLPAGTTVNVVCWALGEPTFGNDPVGAMWLWTSLGGWVHSYLVTPVAVPPCGEGTGLGGLTYENCDAARAAGAAPVYVGEPGYGLHLDADRDGVGCED